MNNQTDDSVDLADSGETLPVAVGKLAHDLNNMLLPLMMGIDLLRQPMDDAARNEILDLLKASTQRAELTSRHMVSLTQPAIEIPPIPSSQPFNASLSLIPRAKEELVLVIDDEPMVLGVIRHILESHGYKVMTAASGNEGSELFQRNLSRVKVVVVDMFMPLVDGHEVIRRLINLDPRVRIIAISGQTGEIFGPDFLNANVRGFLHKPFTSYTLLKTMDMLVH